MRLFVNEINGDKCVLRGDAHRHVAYSLRSRVGDAVTLCPQDGCDYIGSIENITQSETTVKISSVVKSAGEPKVELTVFCAVPNKGDKLDLIAQKLTELGVGAIRPIMTEFTQGKAESVRTDRLSRICEEAAKQCGRGVIPKVFCPIKFGEMLDVLEEYDLTVFPYEKEKTLSLKKFLHDSSFDCIKKVAVIIGSEGGFSCGEATALRDKGVESVTLGNRILRTETANIAVVSALMYELDEWQAEV